ncbi:uncharacterized protein LOC116104589 [Mastomys coucha]|uniref:uncharacterized protein LOC116104589 n=1 Tax=Mastomys coucha TaxID=35658 RepID=UPI001261D6E3|nr:uncharacterized protein LOC116104589 [Mastomys coucha]
MEGGGNAENPASGAAATFNPGFSFRAQKWCPEAATFASALLLPPPARPPSPPPRAGRRPGTRAPGKRRSQAGGLPTLKPPLRKPTAPLRGLAPVGALWELRRTGFPRASASSQSPAPPVPSSAPRARVIFLPTQPPAHLAGKARLRTHARTHSGWRRQPARTMFLPHQPRHRAHTPDGCHERREMSPADHHTDRPSRPPYTPPTNSGGGHVARRSGVSRDRPQQILVPRINPRLRNPESRELGLLTATSSQEPRAATSSENTDVPPPLPPPPLIVLPLRKGLGNPPAQC